MVVSYLRLRRSIRVRARSFLYLCLRIFFRRFLTTLLISLLFSLHSIHVRHRPLASNALGARPRLEASRAVPHHSHVHRASMAAAPDCPVTSSGGLSMPGLACPEKLPKGRTLTGGGGDLAPSLGEKAFVPSEKRRAHRWGQRRSAYISAIEGSKVKLFLYFPSPSPSERVPCKMRSHRGKSCGVLPAMHHSANHCRRGRGAR
jgi:hypothetical protein